MEETGVICNLRRLVGRWGRVVRALVVMTAKDAAQASVFSHGDQGDQQIHER